MNKTIIHNFDKQHINYPKFMDNVQVIYPTGAKRIRDGQELVYGKWYLLQDSITNNEEWKIKFESLSHNKKTVEAEWNFKKDDDVMVTLPESYLKRETLMELKYSIGFNEIDTFSMEKITRISNKATYRRVIIDNKGVLTLEKI